jgi:hypothetical protein
VDFRKGKSRSYLTQTGLLMEGVAEACTVCSPWPGFTVSEIVNLGRVLSVMAMLQPLTEFSVDLVFQVATRVG